MPAPCPPLDTRSAPDSPPWVVLLPLKPLTGAKSRLLRPDRGALALAMATDTVSAALAVEPHLVAVVVLVTDDARAKAALRPAHRLVHLPDSGGGGLNPALRAAARDARRRWPGLGVAAMSADLPALRPAELALALRRAPSAGRGLVADAAGTGTVLLTASAGVDLAPSFGPGSQRAHLASSAVDLTPLLGDEVPGLRRDVDTVDDLAVARRLGVGAATGALLRAAS